MLEEPKSRVLRQYPGCNLQCIGDGERYLTLRSAASHCLEKVAVLIDITKVAPEKNSALVGAQLVVLCFCYDYKFILNDGKN